MLLSIAMIVKNEELNIERCLKALNCLKNKIDYEIVVVDTGSTDNTIEIARKYTRNIYQHKWNNDFSEMRNLSIKYCNGDWILILDADEVLDSYNGIINFFKENNSDKYNSAIVNLKNMISNNDDDYILGSLTRLFKNTDEFFYTGAVHEQPSNLLPVKHTNIVITHYGYSREDYKVMEYKYERNKKLLLEDLRKGKKSIYTYFQLAQTYSMANKKSEALHYIKKAFALAQKTNEPSNYIYIYHHYAIQLLLRGNANKAIEICEEALNYRCENLDFYYILSKAYIMINNYKKADVYSEKYFKLHKRMGQGYFINDISLVIVSYCKKDDLLKDKILYKYKQNKFKDVILLFDMIEKESFKHELRALYTYSLIEFYQYKKVIEYYKDKEFTDEDVQIIIDIIEKLNVDKMNCDFKLYESLSELDERLNLYIKSIYLNSHIEKQQIMPVYEEFYQWKSVLLKNELLNNDSVLEELEILKKEEIVKYIISLSEDYSCLEKLYKYSKENFLTQDIKKMILLISIEEVLILNNSIVDNEYEKLILRAQINQINYINKIYSEEILLSDNLENVLKPHENFWTQLKKAMKMYDQNKLIYIKTIRIILKYNPEYKKIVRFYLNEVKDSNINEDIIKAKPEFLSVAKKLLEENKVNEAFEVLFQLKKWFKYSPEILNYLGITFYLNENFEEALLNLALSNIIQENDFDTIYNLACVLEANYQYNSAKYYYEKAFELCKDEKLKNEIRNIIVKLYEK